MNLKITQQIEVKRIISGLCVDCGKPRNEPKGWHYVYYPFCCRQCTQKIIQSKSLQQMEIENT